VPYPFVSEYGEYFGFESDYESLQALFWKRSLRMLFRERLIIIKEYERKVGRVSSSIQLASVLRLVEGVKTKYHHNGVEFY